MGCSYDPMPSTVYPSPRELWMEENGFGEVKVDYRMVGSSCHHCGIILSGGRYGVRFLVLHLRHCTISPRAEIPMKTEEECKAFPRTIYT